MAEKNTTAVPEDRWDELEVPVPSRAPVGKLQACVELVKRLIAELPKPVPKKKEKKSSAVVCAGAAESVASPPLSVRAAKTGSGVSRKRKFRIKPGTAFDGTLDFDYVSHKTLRLGRSAMKKMCAPPRMKKLIVEPIVLAPSKPSPPDLHAPVLSFAARLLTYVNEKCDGVAPMAYKPVGISRQIYSRIVSRDDSTVNKRTAMLFCIGLKLDMKESELLLKSAGYAFSGTLPEDRIITWCIENRIWNIEDINEIFRQCSLRPIKPGKDAVK